MLGQDVSRRAYNTRVSDGKESVTVSPYRS